MVTITKYVWDPVFDCVTHELDENNNVKAEYHNEPQQYGGVLSQRRGTVSHYHHHDALGSTRFLTDSSGNVTDTYLHDAWGNLVASTGTTINPFKWVGTYGYYTDNSTAQVYVRARMYQPTVARWTAMDPAFPVDGSNSMLFVRNQPHLAIDASGLACTPTSVGVLQYIPDRGMFNSSVDTLWSATYKIRAEFFTRMETTFTTSNSFADGMTCCCCEVLGLVQTVKQTIHYKKIIQPWNYKSHDWRLDDAICGIPYSKSSVTPPCRANPLTGATKGGMRAMMEDTPGVQFPLFAGYLSYVSQDFETCALCINSKRLFPPDEGMLFDQGRITGATAYGCFTWGHSFKATATSPVVSYRWKRYINDQMWTGGYKTGSGTVPFEFDGPSLNLSPKAPSADFRTAILNASVDLSGCWGSAVTPGMPD